jgi:NADH pyrophosphatase NudC (nudix superfamily)
MMIRVKEPVPMKYCPECAAELQEGLIDQKIRKQCSAGCGFVHWNNPIPVVAAIVNYRDQVLLARNRAWPEGWFALITGFLEQNETPESAVLRELEEELGLSGDIESFVGNYPFFEQNQLLVVYHLRAFGEIKLGAEIAEVKLVPESEVRPWRMGTGPALRDWLQQRQQALLQ